MFKKTFTALLLGSVLASGAVSAADYVIDQEGQHAFVNFKISHLGYSWLYGTFKDFDVTQPESVDLTVGADSMTLSKFQLQQQEAAKSMEKVLADQQAANAASGAQSNYNNQLSLLQSALSQYKANSESLAQEIQFLTEQIEQLDPEKDANLIASLTMQKQVAESKKQIFDNKIVETEEAIEKLKGGNANGV